MATTRKTAIAPAASTAIANIRASLAAEVEHIADQIGKPGGNKIKTTDKVFTLPDGSQDEGPLSLVIVDFVSRNKYYTGRYDPNTLEPPVCFAVGKSLRDLKPSAQSSEPQAASCAECPLNQFGSEGKGKACKNSRYLTVLPPDTTDPAADLMTLEVSPTGVSKFDAMVGTVAKLYGVPPVGVSLDVSFDQTKTYPSLVFSNPQPLTDDLIVAFASRRPEADMILMAEPDMAPAMPPPAPRGRSPRVIRKAV